MRIANAGFVSVWLSLIVLLIASCGNSQAVSTRVQSAAAAAVAQNCLQTLGGVNVQTATIPEIQQAFRQKKLSSEQLVSLYLQRIATFDTAGPALNAIRALAPNAL